MKSFVTAALAACAAAVPTQVRQVAEETIKFSGLAIRSGSAIQYAPIAANGGNFWLNKDTVTYTPDNVPFETNTTNTVFSFYLPGDTLSLDVTVPGGQQVYVAADGAVKYTQAHTANTGEGSFLEGFGIAQGHLLFENTGFIGVQEGEAYKVYAGSKTNLTGLGFAFRAGEDTNPTSAWQYA